MFSAYDADHSLGKIDEISEASFCLTLSMKLLMNLKTYLDTNHQVTSYTTSERILNTEIDTISAAIGGERRVTGR